MAATIPATITHSFEVSEIGKAGVGKSLLSPKIDVVHKNVKLGFQLKLSLKDSGIDASVMYADGPKQVIEMEYQLFVIGANKRILLIKDPLARAFRKGKGWGQTKALPASVQALQNNGYLSADGKTLAIRAQLSIKANEFVAPLQIFASLSHKFGVERLFGYGVESLDGPVVSVAHNNGKLSFKLVANPRSLDHTGHCLGLYVQSVDGLPRDVDIDVELIGVKGRKRQPLMAKRTWNLSVYSKVLCASLPRTVQALSEGGYLSLDKKSIHVIAELSIPESAFKTSAQEQAGPYQVLAVDWLGFCLFQELKTPTATNTPTSNRVEFISKEEKQEDKTHLWAHREVLSFASDVFKDLFDPTKPEESKMESLKKGVVEMDDLSGDALRQMMHFIYLRQTDKDFGSFAHEILPVADRFLIKGLKEKCERSLIDQLDTMQIDELVNCFKDSHTFNLKSLTAACVKVLPFYMEQNNDIEQSFVVSLIELAEQYGYASVKAACEMNLVRKLETADDRPSFLSLLSISRQHDMGMLTHRCVRWFKNNFTQLKAAGFIDELVDDNSENGRDVIHFLMESICVLP